MQEVSESGFKYAALIFSPPQAPEEPREMHGNKETLAGAITSLVPSEDVERWREWLGSVAWQRIERAGRIAVARSPAKAPSVLDDDDRRLQGEAFRTWRAFLLSGAIADSGPDASILSGRAAGDERGAALLTVRSAQQLDRIVAPVYRRRERFIALTADAFEKHWAAHGRHDESWFHRWSEIDRLIPPRLPLILDYALMAHESARSRRLLEFSIPECVRAAEGVIAIPRAAKARNKATMQETFCERALRLVPSLRSDEYVGSDVEGLLPDLYQLRSDCVHGKLPFAALMTQGDAGEERAAQLAYVGDLLAREALLFALRHPDRSIFATREKLEEAWATSTFPLAATGAP